MKRMIVSKLLLFILLIVSTSVLSGELVRNAKVSRLANIASNVDKFHVDLAGGTGPCAGTVVQFKVQDQPGNSIEALNRAVTLASMAFSMDLYVQIHNYTNDNCSGASFIRISKTPF